jgi:hypothetical protein
VLHVSCTPGSSDSTFEAKASNGAETHFSDQESSCSDLRIGGLTNGVTYQVVAYGMNSANNPSPASAAADGTPVPTDDFWNHYKKDGGREQGGCSTGAGALGLLGALSLLALRRRKS